MRIKASRHLLAASCVTRAHHADIIEFHTDVGHVLANYLPNALAALDRL